MTATKVLVYKKAAEARNLIKCHPLTPKLATELFAQKGVGNFRFSAALIEWSKGPGELKGLQRIWGQAYKKEQRKAASLLRSCSAYLSKLCCRCSQKRGKFMESVMDYKLVKTGRKSARMRNTATNSIALVSNDISIFADTPCGMQKLLDVVKEFTK